MIELKSKEQISIMHDANIIVHEIIEYAESISTVGITTLEIDALMSDRLKEYDGAISAFKGYKDYPNVSCISVNSTVVHGIPSEYRLKNGDIVSIDFGVYYKGFAGDAAKTFIVGEASNINHTKLVANTQKGLFAGIEQMIPGKRLNDISLAIDQVSIINNYGNIRHFCGHGIGKKMHEKPSVFNYVENREPNIRLQEGLVLALEPMFSLGTWKTNILSDKWTVLTSDGSMAAHWELSVAITKNGPQILGKGFNKIYE